MFYTKVFGGNNSIINIIRNIYEEIHKTTLRDLLRTSLINLNNSKKFLHCSKIRKRKENNLLHSGHFNETDNFFVGDISYFVFY